MDTTLNLEDMAARIEIRVYLRLAKAPPPIHVIRVWLTFAIKQMKASGETPFKVEMPSEWMFSYGVEWIESSDRKNKLRISYGEKLELIPVPNPATNASKGASSSRPAWLPSNP